MPVQNHVHLQGTDDQPWSTDGAPDNTYKVIFKQLGEKPAVWAATEIALDGTVHVHQLVDSVGDVIQRDYYNTTLLVDDTEYAELKTDVGKKVDWVPPVHPDVGSDHASYVTEMLFVEITQVQEVDPMLNYYKVKIKLEATE